jgi:hypothetical protein
MTTIARSDCVLCDITFGLVRERATPARLLVALTLVVTMAGACAGGTSKSTPKSSAGASTSASAPKGAATTTTAPSKFASLYLQILGPADAATSKFFAALKALPSTATVADVQKIATPAADAIDAADRRLVAVTWPGKVARDAKALALANAQLVGDLRNLASQPSVTSGTWKNQFESDVGKVSNYVNVIHADLTTPNTSK